MEEVTESEVDGFNITEKTSQFSKSITEWSYTKGSGGINQSRTKPSGEGNSKGGRGRDNGNNPRNSWSTARS